MEFLFVRPEQSKIVHIANVVLHAQLFPDQVIQRLQGGVCKPLAAIIADGNTIGKDIFDKLMRLPVGFFDTHQAGDIISRVSYDVDVVSTCLATDVVAIMTSLVTVVGSFVMMVSIPI